jgi:hypothetical protein
MLCLWILTVWVDASLHHRPMRFSYLMLFSNFLRQDV